MQQNNASGADTPQILREERNSAETAVALPSLSLDRTELIRAAQEVRQNAYAPYSNYSVGAAVRTIDGRVFVGCNVENASFGLTVCAERNAIFAAVAAGAREIVAVAVVTGDGGSPCGACRQVLAEFRPQSGDPLEIITTDVTGAVVMESAISALLPFAFDLPS
jgi:cytidine deaminase